MSARPPALAAWLVSRALPERRREDQLGDLEELFVERYAAGGFRAARGWYWRQCSHVLIDAVREW
jgi:hypothetical protein